MGFELLSNREAVKRQVAQASPSKTRGVDTSGVQDALHGYKTDGSFPDSVKTQVLPDAPPVPGLTYDTTSMVQKQSGIRPTLTAKPAAPSVAHPPQPSLPFINSGNPANDSFNKVQNTIDNAISHDMYETQTNIPAVQGLTSTQDVVQNIMDTQTDMKVVSDSGNQFLDVNATQTGMPVRQAELPARPQSLVAPPSPSSSGVRTIVSAQGDSVQFSTPKPVELPKEFIPVKPKHELLKEKVGGLVGELLGNLREAKKEHGETGQADIKHLNDFASKLRQFQSEEYLGGYQVKGVLPEVKHTVMESLFGQNTTGNEYKLLNKLRVSDEEGTAVGLCTSGNDKAYGEALSDLSERGHKVMEHLERFRQHPELLSHFKI